MQDPDARDRDGDPVVVAVGAHHRSQAITKEDLLLHVVNVSFAAGHLPRQCSFSLAICVNSSLDDGCLTCSMAGGPRASVP